MCMCEGASGSKWPTEKTVPAQLSFPPAGVERNVPHPTPRVRSWVFSSGLPEVGGKGRGWGSSGVCVLQLPKCLQGTRPAKVGTGRRKMAPGSLPTGGPDARECQASGTGTLGLWKGMFPPLSTRGAQRGFNAGIALFCKFCYSWGGGQSPVLGVLGQGTRLGYTTGLLHDQAGHTLSVAVAVRPSHCHVCDSTLQRKGSQQNKKRCSVLPIIRDEKINKKEPLLLTYRPGKHENSVDEAEGKWALAHWRDWKWGAAVWEGNLAVPHGFKSVLSDPEIPLLGFLWM